MTLAEFLTYLAGPGVNAAVGVLLSFLVEWFPSWPNVASRVKRIVMLLLCMIVPLVATAGLWLLGAVDPAQPDTWWLAVMAGAAAFSTSQLAALRNVSPTKTRTLN
jgi:Na+/melibiose symporter-like transporter